MNKKALNKQLIVEVDPRSGFCFGVSNAIKLAEETLHEKGKLYSLGEVVHNEEEISRLKNIGLQAINKTQLSAVDNNKVLFRAHGEPPQSYVEAKKQGLEIIDGTCPVVLKLQHRIKAAHQRMKTEGGQVVLFGKPNHAEVNGLMGQTNYECIVIDSPIDLSAIDFSKPIEVFSQTTRSIFEYKLVCDEIERKAHKQVKINDTICRQVSNRGPHLEEFAKQYDVIIFVGGASSSNAKFLFEICKKNNPNSYFIQSEEDLNGKWWEGMKKIGISGATSTPDWLLNQVAEHIEQQTIENV